MELKEEQIKNWLERFGLITKDRQWHQIHVSGHGDGTQIKKVIEETESKKLIPIHTEHEEYHKKWHPNIKTVNQSDSVKL
jgi:mRNA degradation ribonuclease J1/J2